MSGREKEKESLRVDSKCEKYPESVVMFSEYMRAVAEIPSPTESIDLSSGNSISSGYLDTTDFSLTQDRSDMDVTSLSSSDSPISSSYSRSPVSSRNHSCGSLFAKCAEHGRWELLQTFTNKNSQLFKQTFSERYGHQNIRHSDEDSKTYHKSQSGIDFRLENSPPIVGAQKTWLRPPDEQIPGILGRRTGKKNKNRVKFVGSISELNESNGDNTESQVPLQACEEVSTRRHNSVPIYRGRPLSKAFNDLIQIYDKPQTPPDKHNYRNHQIMKCNIFLKDRFPGSDDNSESHQQRRSNRWVTQRSNVEEKTISSEKDDQPHKHRMNNNDDHMNHCYQFNKDSNNSNGNHRRGFNKTSNYHSISPLLKNGSTELENEIDFLETEIVLLRRELKKKDLENVKLQREIHKLKSVLQDTRAFKQEGDLLWSLHDSHGMPGQIQQVHIPNPNKKQGVSGESSNHGEKHDDIEIQRYDKDFRSKQLIKDAIMENNFLKNLDMSQVREIVESVYAKEFSKGDYVVREGEAGSHLFVSAEGEFEVIKEQRVLGRMGPGKAFGELAILYNCRRTASIKVVSDAKVWVLDRQVFQKIMMKTGLQRLQENLNFLRSVPLLKSLSTEVLAKVADVLEVDFYPSGEHIIRQGASGDTFFIISSGSVKVTQEKPGREGEEEIRILKKGDYFGEQALLKEDWRTANVIALDPGVECLTLDRESFIQLIGDLSELQEKDYGDQVRGFTRPSSSSCLCDKQEYDYIRLQDLDIIGTLGVGGFGRVELVQYSKNRSLTFALKCLKKQHIVETKQQEHVYSEKNIMMSCNSPFICRLYRTFRDSKYVYMLQEALLGGEVWTILREKGCFDDNTTKFVAGCVIEAFEYLHTRGIVYRDLKPENLLLDGKGYIKLVDFGFSKRIGFSSKTWTFCGTPEYLAPEIILNKGHDRAVDYWSLGILMHELLTGIPPFTAPDPMRTYTFILKGIDMIDFPKYITKGAQSLIKRLCKDAPSERLGYQRGGIQDIKKHKWFQSFDWEGLKQRILVPPVAPSVLSSTDTSNFDSFSKDVIIPPDEFSNWDAEF